MKHKKITQETLLEFKKYLIREEKSRATIEKYLRDVQCFIDFAADRKVDK